MLVKIELLCKGFGAFENFERPKRLSYSSAW